jgi:hypothetical protein
MHPDIDVINPGSTDKKEIWNPKKGSEYLLSVRGSVKTDKRGWYFGKTRDHHLFYQKIEEKAIIGSGTKPALIKYTVWRDDDALLVTYLETKQGRLPAIEVKRQGNVKKPSELEYILQQIAKMEKQERKA